MIDFWGFMIHQSQKLSLNCSFSTFFSWNKKFENNNFILKTLRLCNPINQLTFCCFMKRIHETPYIARNKIWKSVELTENSLSWFKLAYSLSPRSLLSFSNFLLHPILFLIFCILRSRSINSSACINGNTSSPSLYNSGLSLSPINISNSNCSFASCNTSKHIS